MNNLRDRPKTRLEKISRRLRQCVRLKQMKNKMGMRNIISVLIFSGTVLLFSSCSNTKYIPANDALYTGAKVKLEAPEISRKKRKVLKATLEGMTRPRPNSSILGLRPKLWFYNIAGNPKKKNSPAALLKKMGEPPVLLSDVSLDHNVSVLQNALENQGFFRATV